MDSIDDYGFSPEDGESIAESRRWSTASLLLGAVATLSMLIVVGTVLYFAAISFPWMDTSGPMDQGLAIVISVAGYSCAAAGGAGLLAGLIALSRKEPVFASIMGVILSGIPFAIGLAYVTRG